MNSMRPAGVIAILLILLVLFAGCGQRVPSMNTTGKNPWGNTTTPPQRGGPGLQYTVVPTTTSPFLPATLLPGPTPVATPNQEYRNPPPVANASANLTLIDEKTMVFTYNTTAYTYSLTNPPLLIDYTLTVPNITRTKVVTDPVTGGDDVVSVSYPDPVAGFTVTVRDLKTRNVLAQDGYGGQYDISYRKQVWVRYPGDYYIEFWGNRVTADVKFEIYNNT